MAAEVYLINTLRTMNEPSIQAGLGGRMRRWLRPRARASSEGCERGHMIIVGAWEVALWDLVHVVARDVPNVAVLELLRSVRLGQWSLAVAVQTRM